MARNPYPNTQNTLLEEFHYYPFGMCFEVSKSPTLGKSAAIKYNSQLHEHDEFEDANGNVYGLEDYNFAFRNYDAQIGRWLQPDPLMQHPSPYLAMSNNPVSFTDPLGLWDLAEFVVTAKRLYPNWSDFNNVTDPFDRASIQADLVYDNGGKYRKNGEAYGEAASRYNDNLKNWTMSLTSGDAKEAANRWGMAGTFLSVASAGLKVAEKASLNESKNFVSSYGVFKNSGRIKGLISANTVTRYGKMAASANANFAKIVGIRVGLLGGVLSVVEGARDGSFSKGDAFKTIFSFATVLPGLGTTVGLIDLGLKLTTDEGGISDRLGKWIDKK